MAGTAANFEYVLVGRLTDKGSQRRLDTGVVVLPVSPVVCLGDLVVVYVPSHWVSTVVEVSVSRPIEPGYDVSAILSARCASVK
jgi:hypothetical protein